MQISETGGVISSSGCLIAAFWRFLSRSPTAFTSSVHAAAAAAKTACSWHNGPSSQEQ
jgi:hypothetical protein